MQYQQLPVFVVIEHILCSQLCINFVMQNSWISKFLTNTVIVQEMETGFDMCAVCIEGYRSCDVIRILPCK